MIYLILYLIGFAVFANFQLKTIPDNIGTNKVLLTASFYPINVLFSILNIPLSFVGVYLKFQSCVIMNEKEMKEVSDKQQDELRDILQKIMDEEDDNEEK